MSIVTYNPFKWNYYHNSFPAEKYTIDHAVNILELFKAELEFYLKEDKLFNLHTGHRGETLIVSEEEDADLCICQTYNSRIHMTFFIGADEFHREFDINTSDDDGYSLTKEEFWESYFDSLIFCLDELIDTFKEVKE